MRADVAAATEALERRRERGEGGRVMTAATGRIITAVQRALTAPDPLDALEALTHLRAALDAFEREQVRRALDQGESFAGIARAVGITRQAAHRRYRNLTIEPPAYTPRMLRALQLARAEAARVDAETVEVEHLARVLAGRAMLRGVERGSDADRAAAPRDPARDRATHRLRRRPPRDPRGQRGLRSAKRF